MTRALTLLPLLVASCIPTMPAGWSGSPPPLPPPPPPAHSAFDDDSPAGDRDDEQTPPQLADARGRTSESRQERHEINGRSISDSTSGSERRDGKPTPSSRQLADIVNALEKLPRADRAKRLGSLIDRYYLTVDNVVALLEPVPIPDDLRAISVVACSVVDPENASRISDGVTRIQLDEAISLLTQRCFAKFPHDSRPPGKLAEKAAPPPGAYLLPSER